MKTKIFPSRWLAEAGKRLDPGPYLSGAVEIRELLKKLPIKKEKLSGLTKGYQGGIFNGPQFARAYVDSPQYGVPFLGSSSMLLWDLSSLPYLRRKEAESPKLRHLRVEEGMTLISCSGTVGRTVYARPDMAGIWSSQHIMKVVPDPHKIPPGYLYAFLSSRFGVPLLTSGTYGAMIQHIEPEHIIGIDVPRLAEAAEQEIHKLIVQAAGLLDSFGRGINQATADLFCKLGLSQPGSELWYADGPRLGWGAKEIGTESFRALNHDPRCAVLRKRIQMGTHDPLGDLCRCESFKGKIIFKRIDADPMFGWKLVGQREAFRIRPEGRHIAPWSVKNLGLKLSPWSVLIPSHGTLGDTELYCRALVVTERTSQYAFSGDFFRCVPLEDRVKGAYLYAFLRSETAFRLLRGISIGSKQQEQHPSMMYRLPIPRLSILEEDIIAGKVTKAAQDFDNALELEERAWQLLEDHLQR